MNEEELRKLPFVTHIPQDGRIIRATSYWDDRANEWVLYLEVRPGELGRIRGGAPVRGEYYGRVPADSAKDIELPLSTLIRQHLSFPEVLARLDTVESDIHLICEILETFEILAIRARTEHRASFLAGSQLEFLVRVVRSIYDQLQRLIKELSQLLFRVDDPSKRVMKDLPESFAAVALQGETPRTADELIAKFGMPPRFAEFYATHAGIFVTLRAIRNRIEHSGHELPLSYRVERGIAVDVTERPWRDLPMWEGIALVNGKLGPLRAVFRYLVAHILNFLAEFTAMFGSSFAVPPPISEDIRTYLHNAYGHRLLQLELTDSWDETTERAV